MRFRFYLVLFLFLCALFISCSETADKKKSNSKIPSNIAVLVFDQEGNWPFRNSYKPTSLNEEEILTVDSLLRNCINDTIIRLKKEQNENLSIPLEKTNYKHQYIAAINENGQKEVWVNSFCHEENDKWKKEVIFYKDGGNCYFNMKVNLYTKKCYEISVNNSV